MTEPAEPKQTVVTIHALKNGYLVTGGSPWARDSRHTDDSHVFESFNALTAHLGRVMPNFKTPAEEVKGLTEIFEQLNAAPAPLKWTKRTKRGSNVFKRK